MKQLFTILAAVLLTASVFAQSPEKISYQAVVRDVTQTLITNQTVGMQISILQGSATGTVVYSETQTPTTNINGLLSIEIGDGPGFDVIDWANGPYYIKTETDPTGGTNYSITGTSQLLSVPYALYAKTADSISGTIVETDPIFGASVAAGITQTDTTYWNNKLDVEIDGDTTNELQYLSLVSDTIIFLVPNGGFVVLPDETDPIFGASVAAGITGTDTAYWNNKLDVETDPIFGASVAAGITGTDTTYWNNKLDVETDPIFGASVASGITSGDTAYWNNKLDSYTESDPIFGASVAAGITGTDTTYWNNKLDVETDPIFGASVAAGITQTDTTNWNTAFNWGDHSVAGYFANGGEATGADRTLGNTDNYSLGLKTNNATRLHITNGGNVGIGTTSPNDLLEIKGGSPGSMFGISLINNGYAQGYPSLIFRRHNNTEVARIFTHQTGLHLYFALYAGDFMFQRRPSGIIHMIIKDTGKVGIGISNPSEKLSVSGVVESTTGGFKFPDGTVQTTAASGSGGTSYAVGDFALGGIVFWVDESAEHGLICAKTDQSAGVRCIAGIYTNTMAMGDGPLAGEMNTSIIIANQGFGDGSTYAARVCAEFQATEGGKTYGDWYLPSKGELHLMYLNKATIDATATANGGSAIVGEVYWSSTENSIHHAWLQNFNNGNQYHNDKYLTYRVRAVRAF
jgi:hypothetical protein